MAEKKKRSWRDIDRQRDRSSHRSGGKRDSRSELERALENRRIKGMYLKEAEKLFRGTKGRPGHAKDQRAIHDAYGTAKFKSTVTAYVGKYGLPEDWGTLLLLLDLKSSPGIVCDAIEALCTLAVDKGPVERQGLKSKLTILSMSAGDPEVMETAEGHLADLS